MIEAYYRAEVAIPRKVWDAFRDSEEMEKKFLAATNCSIDAGQEWYGNPYSWATFSTREAAMECQKALMDMNYYLAAKLLPEEPK